MRTRRTDSESTSGYGMPGWCVPANSAAGLAMSGHVRVNGAKVRAPAAPVRCGDVVTVALDRNVRVMRVCGFASRRGDAEEARRLFEDLA